MAIISNVVETRTRAELHPKLAPTFELVTMLPGPITTAAVMNAGPSDRNKDIGAFGMRRRGFSAGSAQPAWADAVVGTLVGASKSISIAGSCTCRTQCTVGSNW